MAVKVKKANNEKMIINQLVIKAPARKVNDIGVWRNAMKSADTGRVKQLFDLFEDLELDGYLYDAYDKRIGAITNAELSFQNADGESVDEINALMDSPAWEELLVEILKARFWGRSGVEFDFTDGLNVHSIPAKHINLERKEILLNDSDAQGISYDGDDHILVVGKKRDFGLYLKTAPYVIYKRGGFGDYAQWLELFGMPQRIGKYSSFDPESRKLLEEALERAGSAPYAIIPKEAEVETVQSSASSSGASYDDFRKACNEEILITILGQTLTTIQGDKGARSLGEVHKEVEENKNKTDMRFVQRILNFAVLPLLEKRGYPVSGGKFIFPKAAEPLTVSDIVQLADIMEIPTSYLHEKYSIPVAQDGEAIAKKSQLQPTNIEPGQEDIKNYDRNFFIRLWDFFVHAPAETTGALAGTPLTLSDETIDDRVIRAVVEGCTKFDPELFRFISSDLVTALNVRPPQLADVGFVYGYESDAFRTAQELNIFHFSAGKTLAQITELNRIYRESKSFEEFHSKAQQVTETFNKRYQKTEFETATLISASTVNYQRLIQKTTIFPYWEYRTVEDERVRPEHERLHGVILPASDPRWKKIWPPNGWKCRCYVVPRMAHEVQGLDFNAMRARVDEYFDTPEWKMNESQGFGKNRALLPEVFNENQMYIKKFPTMASKYLKDVNYQTYKLGSYEQCRAKAKEEFKPYTGTSGDFFKTLKTEDNKVFFEDYKGRSALFDEAKYLKGHSEEKYKVRTVYIEAASETLKRPDEVWINDGEGKGFKQFTFIKYYKDVAVAVTASIENGTVYKVNTWFPIAETTRKEGKTRSKIKEHKYQYRSGLLIKQNPIE